VTLSASLASASSESSTALGAAQQRVAALEQNLSEASGRLQQLMTERRNAQVYMYIYMYMYTYLCICVHTYTYSHLYEQRVAALEQNLSEASGRLQQLMTERRNAQVYMYVYIVYLSMHMRTYIYIYISVCTCLFWILTC